jgi:uncharacterized protein (DUF3820 family)
LSFFSEPGYYARRAAPIFAPQPAGSPFKIPEAYSMEDAMPNPDLLLQLVRTRMPLGKYKDALLCDLPVSYLEWFGREGFPKGKLGMLLQTVYEIKINGLGHLLEPLKRLS